MVAEISPFFKIRCFMQTGREAHTPEPLSLILNLGVGNPFDFPSRSIFRTGLRGPLKRRQFKHPINDEQWQLNCHTLYFFAGKAVSLKELLQIEASGHELLSSPYVDVPEVRYKWTHSCLVTEQANPLSLCSAVVRATNQILDSMRSKLSHKNAFALAP